MWQHLDAGAEVHREHGLAEEDGARERDAHDLVSRGGVNQTETAQWSILLLNWSMIQIKQTNNTHRYVRNGA